MRSAVWSRRLYLLVFIPAIWATGCTSVRGNVDRPYLRSTPCTALRPASTQQDGTPIETAVTEEDQDGSDDKHPSFDQLGSYRPGCFPDIYSSAAMRCCFWRYTLSTCHNATALNSRAPPPTPA